MSLPVFFSHKHRKLLVWNSTIRFIFYDGPSPQTSSRLWHFLWVLNSLVVIEIPCKIHRNRWNYNTQVICWKEHYKCSHYTRKRFGIIEQRRYLLFYFLKHLSSWFIHDGTSWTKWFLPIMWQIRHDFFALIYMYDQLTDNLKEITWAAEAGCVGEIPSRVALFFGGRDITMWEVLLQLRYDFLFPVNYYTWRHARTY